VSPLRNVILNNRVGGHFAATLAARPVLGGGEQLLPDSLAPVAFLDIPSLDVADWPRRVAAVSMGAQSSFEKSDEPAVRLLGDEVDQRQGGWGSSVEDCGEFLSVFFTRRFRP